MKKPKLLKNRVFYRLLADGTVIGPYHTREWLHRVVETYKWFRRPHWDAGLD